MLWTKKRDLENRINVLMMENEKLRAERNELQKVLNGEHRVSGYCASCKNGGVSPLSGMPYCRLECKCKDAEFADGR